MGGDSYVHDDFRHSKLQGLGIETWVSDCVASVRLSACCPRTSCASALVSPGPFQTHCGATWLDDLSLKPNVQEK